MREDFPKYVAGLNTPLPCRSARDKQCFISSLEHEQLAAAEACTFCPLRAECYDWGLNNEAYNVWGGTTEHQRRDLRKKAGIVLPDPLHRPLKRSA